MENTNLKLEIISVGTEVLMGNIVNTNAHFLASSCTKMGYVINHHQTVGDNKGRLLDSIKLALSRADVVITTGGLGPTGDDITKEVAAEVFGKNLVLNKEVKEHIEDVFRKTNRPCPIDAEYRTAMIPDGATIIKNDNGTAPGIILSKNNKTLILLPGPPIEIDSIYKNGLRDYLTKLSSNKLTSVTLKLMDIGETVASDKIKDLIDNQTNPTIAPYAKTSEVHFRITYSGSDLSKLNETVEKIKSILGEYIYTEKDDEEIQHTVFNLLKKNNYKLAFAESCTGGMASYMFTGIPSASTCFNGGFVTYTNELKEKLLDVNKKTIDEFGAVSSKTAIEMALGALSKTNSDIAISITGNAGPSASEGKEVGLVYIGYATKSKSGYVEFHFQGMRDKIRLSAAKQAFNIARKVLLNKL
jgi:nicotinamide-nucleotide amidase